MNPDIEMNSGHIYIYIFVKSEPYNLTWEIKHHNISSYARKSLPVITVHFRICLSEPYLIPKLHLMIAILK